ncbi:MAG: hypothetical protein IKV63_07300 [Clostridia bacterium]|nr:hypothetical protein [Clostridia bacterium]
MNKKFIVFLFILLLCGCKAETSFEDIRQHYLNMTQYSGVYKYETDFGGVFEYVCQYEYTDGNGRLTILSPEEIAGITAITDSTGDYLEFEDITLTTYLPDSEEASPVSAIHRLISDIRTRMPSLITETEVLEITFESGDYTKIATLSKEDFAILSCEIFYLGDRILNITLQ